MEGDGVRILVVDDDADVRSLAKRVLEREGYECVLLANGDEAVEQCRTIEPDAIVLDIMMAGMDGFATCEKLREQGVTVPILFLSAKGDLVDKTVGFRSGADDYLVKPFEPQELLIRIRAHLRLYQRLVGMDKDVIASGDLTIDGRRQVVFLRGTQIDLTPKEFRILLLFAQNPGTVFTKDQIIEEVWGEEFVSETTSIAVFIRRIREKIEEEPSKPKRLKTIWRVGYKYEPFGEQ